MQENINKINSVNYEVVALVGKIARAYNEGKTVKLSKPDVSILYEMFRRSQIVKDQ